MGWSVNIGTIAGTAVRVHITFLIFLVWIWVASYLTGGLEAAWNGLLFMILLFACVLAHEFGHILTARRFGVATPDVTLLPIGGVARLERIPENPREELLIALAGPAVNVVIAIGLEWERTSAGRSTGARRFGSHPCKVCSFFASHRGHHSHLIKLENHRSAAVVQ